MNTKSATGAAIKSKPPLEDWKPNMPKPKKKPKYVWNPQESMFDGYGYPHFTPDRDSIPDPKVPGRFGIADMVVQITDADDIREALVIFAHTIALLHNSWELGAYIRPMLPKPRKLDNWECSKCEITFRSWVDDGVIRATFKTMDHIVVSMPHMMTWKHCGLKWLWGDNGCPKCNGHNSAPWRPRACSCK